MYGREILLMGHVSYNKTPETLLPWGRTFNLGPTHGTRQIINHEQGSADALAPLCKSLLRLLTRMSSNQELCRPRGVCLFVNSMSMCLAKKTSISDENGVGQWLYKLDISSLSFLDLHSILDTQKQRAFRLTKSPVQDLL